MNTYAHAFITLTLAIFNHSGSLLLLSVPDGLSGSISVYSLGRGSALALDGAADLDDAGVDGAGDAVLHLDVELWDDVGLEGSVLLEVLLGGGVHDVADGKALHGLVLGAEATAVHADDGLDEAAVVLVAAVVSTLDGHVVN
jgi:hypothetical protein